MRYILASKSPRRKEILLNMGIAFDIVTADTDESSDITDARELCEELSLRKAIAVRDHLLAIGELDPADIIIASDTVVECEGEILGKPKDKEDARRMLTSLSGRAHRVFSGIALVRADESKVSHSVTAVYVDEIEKDDLERYLDTNEPYDKAGAYGIQGYAGRWIGRIDGCYFGVVGMSANVLDKLHRELTGRPIK
ncbi:MAG: septum formation protein Maf [Clostridia bacterium]|nr:septum formation protein Maf [Clostridia bacterium]